MNSKEAVLLAKERVELIRDVVAMNKQKGRIPFIDNTFTWKILDQGYKLSETINDYEKMEQCVRSHQELYQPDAVRDVGTRNGFKIIQGWAKPRYIIDDENGYISALDDVFMNDDEYGELISDRPKFIWSKVLTRRYPELKHSTKEQMVNLIKGFQDYMGFAGKMNGILKAEYGVPPMSQYGLRGSGHEYFVNYLRGLSGTGVDQRRHKSELMEAIKMYDEKDIYPVAEAMKASPGANTDFAFDVSGGCLSHSILSPKQFEEMYLPGFKAGLDACVESGKTIYVFVQSGFSRFVEYLQDYPKGHICIHLEQEDPYEIRKLLPNICICGGMPITTLGSGTKEQVIDKAKQLIDDLGRDGGFIMSTDKILSFRNDATRENLKALTEFTREYMG